MGEGDKESLKHTLKKRLRKHIAVRAQVGKFKLGPDRARYFSFISTLM